MLRIAVRRAASSLLFPWFSREVPAIQQEALPDKLEKAIKDTFSDGFSQVYSHILRTLVAGRLDTLQESLEPTLHAKVVSDLSYLARQGQVLTLLNPGAQVQVAFCNAKHHFGVPINRAEVRDFSFIVVHPTFSHYVSKKDVNMYMLDLLKLPSLPDSKTIAGLMKQEVLKLDCLVRTSMKLAVLNAAGETLQGGKEGEEEHLLQFAAGLTDQQAQLGLFSMPDELEMQNWQWTLTDIDHELSGNPYKVSKSF